MAYNVPAMEPRIRYARTEDGVSIAFWTLGEGVPLVRMQPTPFSHSLLEWSVPEIRIWHEPLAERYKLIRFDHRGTGLSQRDAIDFSLRAQVNDLEAVLDRLGLDEVAVMALYGSGPLAIEYAARHPERVSHLILLDVYARAPDYYQLPQLQAIVTMVDKDWELFTENVSHLSYGWSEESARRFAAFMRECVGREAAKAHLEADARLDVTAALAQVRQPTLVLQHSGIPFPTIDTAREIASRIPDARFVVLDGTWRDFSIETALTAIDDLLGGRRGAVARRQDEAPAAFRTVLFTDVEGSTGLTQRLGDAKARDLLRQHERIVREALKAHGGSELKTMGDGFMASFSSATRSLQCAIAIQRAFAAWNASLPARPEALEGRAEPQPPTHGSTGSPRAGGDVGPMPLAPLHLRIGLNAGEPVAEEGDLFGTAVIEAARIAAAARGGEILVSNVVRELAKGKEFVFADRGDILLKGFDEPVRLFEVKWQE
jgi:class 3 adenylate cyclase/pimeloyl-ACP methyl ester carboxylesterase